MSDKSRAERNAERDEEIKIMVERGAPYSEIASLYGITHPRISQIVNGRDRSNERKRAPCVTAAIEVSALQRLVIEPAPGGVRPRLRKNELGSWECSGGGITRSAKTFQAAYHRWLGAAILQAQRRPAEAFTPPAAVKPVRRQPNGRGKSIDAVKPPAAAPKVDLAEPIAPYAGPVTVLAGTAPRRELKLSATLQLNGARAAEVQPRMVSIAGSAAREDAA